MTKNKQRPTEDERIAYEYGFRACCLANGIPYVLAEKGWSKTISFRIEISDKEAEYLFPNHVSELAEHITKKLKEEYEKFTSPTECKHYHKGIAACELCGYHSPKCDNWHCPDYEPIKNKEQ